MTLTEEQIEELKGLINSVLERIYDFDIQLIQRGGMERSISFRFGLYFFLLVQEIDSLAHLNIDLEYNKNGLEPKRTRRRRKGVVPDFILHRRGNNDENVLVVELKGWWNNEPRVNDQIKLEDFVNQEGEYKYGLGVLIELNKENFVIEEYKIKAKR